MKVAILGKNSYICNNFENYSKKYNFEVVTINVRDDSWEKINFKDFDCVLCPIGIAHVSTDPSMEQSYYRVNRDLPIAIAKKVKKDGCNYFVFFSSMIVYGKDLPIGNDFLINKGTEINPENFYGRSKYEAENGLLELEDNLFKVAIVRIPMVYGPKCKGNFPKLLKIAKKLPICPNIDNKRSMIFIDNLCEFFCMLINSKDSGLFHPQNSEYVSTIKIIEIAATYFGRKIWFTNMFNPIIRLFSKKLDIINRIFGTKIYDKDLSPKIEAYNLISFEESVKLCVEAFSN